MNSVLIKQARARLLAALGQPEGLWESERPLLDLYTLLVLTRGVDCTCEDIVTAQEIAWISEGAQAGPLNLGFPPDLAAAVELRDAVLRASVELGELDRRTPRRNDDQSGGAV